MPMIHIEYDDKKVKEKDAISLSCAAQKIVSEATGIEDVFVYANTSKIKIKAAPIEIFVSMSEHKISNLDGLAKEIKSGLSAWKKESKFQHPINFTLIPMKWKIEIGI